MLSEMQFLDFIITNVDYKVSSLTEEKGNNLEFAYGLDVLDDVYVLSILTKIKNTQKDHSLDIIIETKGRFSFVEGCDLDDDQKKNIVKTNGSAILYPYVRSLIYNLTSADTHGKAVILPTINFKKAIEEIDAKSNQNNDDEISG